MKDDSRSGRLSTSKTEVNVEQVRQVMCGDCQLTVQMITGQLNMKEDSVWKMIIKDLDIWKILYKNSAKTSLSIFELNQICFVTSPQATRQRISFTVTQKPSAKAVEISDVTEDKGRQLKSC